MLPTRSLALVCLALPALLAVPAGTALAQAGLYRIEPIEATSCDNLILRGERKFPDDCDRDITVEVGAPDGLFVDVVLTATARQPVCNDFPRSISFDVDLGVFSTGRYLFRVIWDDVGTVEASIGVEVIPGGCANDFGFLRADVNGDGTVDLGDPVATLNALFLGGAPIGCEAAADSNASSDVDLTDAVYSLNYLFLGGFAPPEPFPDCGAPAGGNTALDCEEPHCIVDLPPFPVWLARPDGCVQCEPCNAPTVDELVEQLRSDGIDVLHAIDFFVDVCEACTICASGRNYAVLVAGDDVETLEALGWTLLEEPPSIEEL